MTDTRGQLTLQWAPRVTTKGGKQVRDTVQDQWWNHTLTLLTTNQGPEAGDMTWVGVWMSQRHSKEQPKRASYTLWEEKLSPPPENLPRVTPIRFYNASCWEHRILRLPAHLSQAGVYLSFSSPPTRTAQVASSTECGNQGIENSLEPSCRTIGFQNPQ